MTVSTLVKVSDQLTQDLKEIIKQVEEVEQNRLGEYSKLTHSYFEEVLEDDDEIHVGSSSITFLRPQEGYNYKKDLLTFRIGSDDWRDEEKTSIDTSFYSTTDNSEYELRRMIIIGKVGQIIFDFKDDILAGWNEIRNRYKNQLKELNTKRFSIEREISSISDQIRDIEKQTILTKVESEGITINSNESNKFPTLQLSYSDSVYSVKKLRILSKTKSGKSCDVEVVREIGMWDAETSQNVKKDKLEVYTKVRMNNILQFLQYNSERISVS